MSDVAVAAPPIINPLLFAQVRDPVEPPPVAAEFAALVEERLAEMEARAEVIGAITIDGSL